MSTSPGSRDVPTPCPSDVWNKMCSTATSCTPPSTGSCTSDNQYHPDEYLCQMAESYITDCQKRSCINMHTGKPIPGCTTTNCSDEKEVGDICKRLKGDAQLLPPSIDSTITDACKDTFPQYQYDNVTGVLGCVCIVDQESISLSDACCDFGGVLSPNCKLKLPPAE